VKSPLNSSANPPGFHAFFNAVGGFARIDKQGRKVFALLRSSLHPVKVVWRSLHALACDIARVLLQHSDPGVELVRGTAPQHSGLHNQLFL
jgi:hypothetical protein